MKIGSMIPGLLVCTTTLTLGACAGEDPLVWISGNALVDSKQNCEINSRLLVPFGRLDVADTEGRTPLDWARGVFLATHPAEPKPSSIALIERLTAR